MAAIIVNNGDSLNDKMSFKVTTTDYTQSVRDTISVFSDHALYVTGDRTKSKTYSSLDECLSCNEMFCGEICFADNMTISTPMNIINSCVINLNGKTVTWNTPISVYAASVSNGANVIIKDGKLLSPNVVKHFNITNGSVSLVNAFVAGVGRLFNVCVNEQESLSAKATLTIDKDSVVTTINTNGEPAIFQKSANVSAYYNPITKKYEADKAPRSCVTVDGKIYASCLNSNEYTYCLCDNGSDIVGSDVVVNDGAILSCSNGPAIHRASCGYVTLNGGQIYGTFCGIDMRTGHLLVPASSTVTVKGTGPKKNYEGGHIGGQGASQLNTGDGILIESCSYGSNTQYGFPPRPPEVKIYGGTFRSAHADGIGSYSHSIFDYAEYTQEDRNNNIKLTDGNFGVVGTCYKITNATGTDRTKWTWNNVIITENDDSQWYGRVEHFVRGGDIEPIPTTQPYKRLTGENGSYNIIANGFTVAS